MYSGLKRKTPLKVKTVLKAKSSLVAKRSLRDSYALKIKAGEKEQTKKQAQKKIVKRKNTVYKPSYPYKSIFTDNLNMSVITGADKQNGADVHVHHIFGASNKANSEKYAFLVPLRADWHDMADYGIHFNKELDLKYKRKCEEYYIGNIGTKEQFISEFGKWW